MKKLTTIIAAILLTASVTMAHSVTDKKQESTYEMSMYFDGNSNTLKTFYKKTVGQNLKVVLKTVSGKTLHVVELTKRTDKASIHFNVENLPDGTYILQMTDGDTSTTKKVTLGTKRPLRLVQY